MSMKVQVYITVALPNPLNWKDIKELNFLPQLPLSYFENTLDRESVNC